MTLSLYAQYLQERSNRGILETEDGFMTFEYLPEDFVYIVDMFVKKESRNKYVATEMADKICEQAVKDGKKFLLGSIDAGAKNAAESTKVLEAYGMTVHKVAPPMIYYIKKLNNVEVLD